MNIQKYHLSLDNESIFNKCTELYSSDNFQLEYSPILIDAVHNFHMLENQPHTWEEFSPLVRLLDSVSTTAITRSWFNIMDRGSSVKAHDHARATELVCVYYALYDASHPPLEFRINDIWTPYEFIQGDCIVFPKHLVHRVQVQESSNIRCSIAFNM